MAIYETPSTILDSTTWPFPVWERATTAKRIPAKHISPPPAKSARIFPGTLRGNERLKGGTFTDGPSIERTPETARQLRSCPAMGEYFPFCRNPVSRATIKRGFRFRSTSFGLNPRFSRTPRRNGSMSTSTLGINRSKRSLPLEDFRSTVMEDLFRMRTSELGVLADRPINQTN